MNTTSTAETKGFAKVTSDVGVVDDLSDEFCYELVIFGKLSQIRNFG